MKSVLPTNPLKILSTISLISLTLSMAACESGTATVGTMPTAASENTGSDIGGNGTGDMFSVIQSDDRFDTLQAALQATGLDAVLANTDETYTLFAPNDAAFDALGTNRLNELLADTTQLTNILLYHTISGQAVDADSAIRLAGRTVESAINTPLQVSLDGAELKINDASVASANISTSNGLIHEIDTVLFPPATASAPF